MYYGITWLQAKSYKADAIELYKSCVDYATTEKAREQAIQTLIADAKKDEQIAEIKNVQPFDSGFAEYIDEKGNQSYHHPTYGRITYIKEIDRLAVALYYSYTAVMKDGSEKQGANAIDVIIPIDWAEVYGDKYLLEEKAEAWQRFEKILTTGKEQNHETHIIIFSATDFINVFSFMQRCFPDWSRKRQYR